ncbi:MAG: hypothetical protein N3F66_10315 [Spirochaetes bacterium]|nr:hypothetical protein [Spirochaetota bacterium]
MIDASALFIFTTIGSVFVWIVLLFKVVMSPFSEKTKLKLVGVLLIIALCYILIPSWVVKAFALQGYGVPAAIVSSLFLGQVILYFLINAAIKRFGKLKQ